MKRIISVVGIMQLLVTFIKQYQVKLLWKYNIVPADRTDFLFGFFFYFINQLSET